VVVRFLHLTRRQVGAIDPPLAVWAGAEPPFRPVESLRVGDRIFQTWQEAEEREIAVGPLELGAMVDRPHHQAFAFPGRRWSEPIAADDGSIAGRRLLAKSRCRPRRAAMGSSASARRCET
jgi:hypothetical protein